MTARNTQQGEWYYEFIYREPMYPSGGETTPPQNAAFLAALSTKSAKAETTDEIGAYVKSMKDAL